RSVDNSDYSTVFYMNLGLSIILYLLLFVLSPIIARLFNNYAIVDILRVLSTILILQSLTNVQITKLTKELKFKLQLILQLPSVIVGAIVGILLAVYGFGVWSLVYMQITRFLILTLSYLIKIRWIPEMNFSIP